MISGRKLVASAGHAERLYHQDVGTIMRVEVDVLPDNTADSAVYIGGPQTYAGTGGQMGRRLAQRASGGDSWVRDHINPYHVWIDAENDGDGVSFLLHGIGDE